MIEKLAWWERPLWGFAVGKLAEDMYFGITGWASPEHAGVAAQSNIASWLLIALLFSIMLGGLRWYMESKQRGGGPNERA